MSKAASMSPETIHEHELIDHDDQHLPVTQSKNKRNGT